MGGGPLGVKPERTRIYACAYMSTQKAAKGNYSPLSSGSLPLVVVTPATTPYSLLLRVCVLSGDRYLRCGADGGLYPIPYTTSRRLEAENQSW